MTKGRTPGPHGPAGDPAARRRAVRQALIGQAVGDMLGFQVERQGPRPCARYATAWLRGSGRPQPMRDGFAVGQVSDDTQASLASIRALACGRGVPGIAAELIASAGTLVGAGSNTRAMLAGLAGRDVSDLESEIARRNAAMPIPREGTNGAAMRAWPVALSHEDEDRAMDAVRLSSKITHSHPDAIASMDFAGGPRRIWKAFGADPKWKYIAPLGIATVAWAFACAIRASSAREGILRAISAGGDVDTAAALAGSWLSILHGSESIADLAPLANDRGRGIAEMLADADLLCDALDEGATP